MHFEYIFVGHSFLYHLCSFTLKGTFETAPNPNLFYLFLWIPERVTIQYKEWHWNLIRILNSKCGCCASDLYSTMRKQISTDKWSVNGRKMGRNLIINLLIGHNRTLSRQISMTTYLQISPDRRESARAAGNISMDNHNRGRRLLQSAQTTFESGADDIRTIANDIKRKTTALTLK